MSPKLQNGQETAPFRQLLPCLDASPTINRYIDPSEEVGFRVAQESARIADVFRSRAASERDSCHELTFVARMPEK